MSTSRRPATTIRCILVAAAAGLAGCAVTAGSTGGAGTVPARVADSPAADYRVYVGAESADLIHRIRFGPDGTAVENTIAAGMAAVETEGPHGLAITRDGRFLVVTTGHGFPFGNIWRYELGPDTLVAPPTPLGDFPATVDVSPDGLYAFAVNFNLHGDHVPSSVSVVYLPDMVEVARTTTCTMPHGSRLNPQGSYQYSACMMDDQLVEIDAVGFGVSRRFSVARGAEGPIEVAPAAGHEGMEHGAMAKAAPGCSPTWAQPSADGRHVYVACNKADEILEVSVADWRVERRFPTGRAPYNIAVTPDGRTLVATLKAAAAIQVFDLETGESRGTSATSTTVTHGVVVSPDSRYAFVSSEGVGAEPGTVDVFDLRTLGRVGSVEVGQQAGGIAFWKMEPAPAAAP